MRLDSKSIGSSAPQRLASHSVAYPLREMSYESTSARNEEIRNYRSKFDITAGIIK